MTTDPTPSHDSAASAGLEAVSADPFANVGDDADDATAHELLVANLEAARRGWVPLRKTFVQRPKGSGPQEGLRPSARASVLSDLVRGRQTRALDLLLLVHALQPVLDGTPLRLATWATLLSAHTPCDSVGASRAMNTLVGMKLLERSGTTHIPVLRPRLEDGTDEDWVKAGSVAEPGPGYFTIPHEYWTEGFYKQLKMPGKAMLLLTLSETQDPKRTSFAMAYERAMDWYGVSERTAERGFGELAKANLLLTKTRKVPDRRYPAGRREETWRALADPFSTAWRAHLQAKSVAAARGVDTKATT